MNVLSMDKQRDILCGFNTKIVNLQNAGRREIGSIEEIIPEWNEKIYIIWDEASLPVVQTDLESIKGNEDDIKAVAFETWFVSESLTKFIHFRHDDKIIEFVMEHF